MWDYPSSVLSASRCTSRLQVFCLAFWRVFWLVLGMTVAWQSMRAQVIYAGMFDGHPHPPAYYLAGSGRAIEAFPWDPNLQGGRRWVLDQIGKRGP